MEEGEEEGESERITPGFLIFKTEQMIVEGMVFSDDNEYCFESVQPKDI